MWNRAASDQSAHMVEQAMSDFLSSHRKSIMQSSSSWDKAFMLDPLQYNKHQFDFADSYCDYLYGVRRAISVILVTGDASTADAAELLKLQALYQN